MVTPLQIEQEGWKIVKQKEGYFVQTPYENTLGLLKLQHPALVHLDIYRRHENPATRYKHLKHAHDQFWPRTVWHYWTERRFFTHCENWNYITLAAGASASKSYDIAKLAILFWYANPRERNVTIASVTLSSLMTRVWGYVTNHIREMAIELPYKYYRSTPPRILFEEPAAGKNKIEDDTLHGIFAVTAKVGDDDQAVATWIGKHPKDRIMLILDECTDMPLSILNALPNLNSHPEKFQLIGIGNSNSTLDLHGLLSTPKNGWESVTPELMQWDTKQPRGTCLYFSPYESPAVTDPDPERKKTLSRFLIGEETLKLKELELGRDSENFYRWVLGFWKSTSTEDITVSKSFLKDFSPRGRADWSGYYPITRVAGLDPAFSAGGDGCVLRIGNVGHCMDLRVRVDFQQEDMMFDIPLKAIVDKSVELQIADQVIDILMRYGVPLERLAIDVTGQGRAIGEVIKLRNELRGKPLGGGTPLKIYSMGSHNVNKRKKSMPDILPVNAHILWNTMREYIEQSAVCGLDEKTINQLTSRLIITTAAGAKRLETKQEYKRRMAAIGQGHSPDEADATALCFQVMRLRLGIEPGSSWPVPQKPVDPALIKMSAYQYMQEERSKRQTGALPAADFSGGLTNFVRFKRPF